MFQKERGMIQHKTGLTIKTGKRPISADVTWEDDFENMPIVVFCHGYKGFKDWGCWNLMAREFASRGLIFFKFNFSMNGVTADDLSEITDIESFSQNKYSFELEDITAILDHVNSCSFLESIGRRKDRIILVGHSRGGAMALLSARDERVSKVISLAAPDDLSERMPDLPELSNWKNSDRLEVINTRTGLVLHHKYSFYEDFIENQQILDVHSAVAMLSKPVLLIHGEADESVDVEAAISLSAANPSAELVLLEDENHTFGAKHPWEADSLPAGLSQVVSLCTDFIFGNEFGA